jgi:hypothetical protein
MAAHNPVESRTARCDPGGAEQQTNATFLPPPGPHRRLSFMRRSCTWRTLGGAVFYSAAALNLWPLKGQRRWAKNIQLTEVVSPIAEGPIAPQHPILVGFLHPNERLGQLVGQDLPIVVFRSIKKRRNPRRYWAAGLFTHPSLWRTYVLTETGDWSPAGPSAIALEMSGECCPGGQNSLRSIARAMRSLTNCDVHALRVAQAHAIAVRASANQMVETWGELAARAQRGPWKKPVCLPVAETPMQSET